MDGNTIWSVQKFTCPHCKAVSAFNCVYSGLSFYNGFLYPVSVWSCHNCDRSIFVRNETTEFQHVATGQLRIVDIYPTNEPSLDGHVPEGISSDYIEAAKCYNIGAYKASAVMSRRAIEKTCLNLGADKSQKLIKQIESLKVSGALHPDLADMATEVRLLGNGGAHPEDDGLDEITSDEAKEILDFALEIFDDLYIRPKKVEAMRAKREAKKEVIEA